MTPRIEWFKNRLIDLVKELDLITNFESWDIFRKKSKELAEEIIYITTIWDKSYKDGEQ